MKKLLLILSVFIAGQFNAQIISTYAGMGGAGAFLDGASLSAQFNYPKSISAVGNGDVYVADINNNRIRMISSGSVTTWAGNGISVHADGIGNAASFATIRSIATRTNGVVYVNCGDRIRIIGTNASAGTYLASSVLSAALGSAPNIMDIAFDPATNTLYLADASGYILRSTSSGSAALWATTGSASNYVNFLALRPSGGFIGGKTNGDIVMISSAGIISTIIPSVGGNGVAVHPITEDVFVTKGNQVFVYQDMTWSLLRRYCNLTGGDIDGVSTLARLNLPCDLSFSLTNPNELYIGDVNNNKVRKIEYAYSGTGITGIVNPQNKVGCDGTTLTLTVSATNATNYQWAFNGAPITNGTDYSGVNTATLNILNFNGGLTGTYTAHYANTYTVVNSPANVGVVNIGITPTITAVSAGPSSTVCPGQNTYLYANGTGIFSYQWSTGAGSQGTTIYPTATAIYTITVHNTAIAGSDCIATRTIQVNVKPVPSLSITASNDAICVGQGTSLTINGANSYTWSTASNSTSISVTPTISTTYSAVGIGTNGCIGSVDYSVTVNDLPTLTISTTKTILCTGETATLSASGAQTYTWSNSSSGNFIVVSPTSNATYTISGEDINGCMNTTSFTQSVSVCTGINNQEKEIEVSIYPNPTRDILIIELISISNDLNIELTDVTGRVILNQVITSLINRIDISELNNGVYFLKVRNGNEQTASKVIKQ